MATDEEDFLALMARFGVVAEKQDKFPDLPGQSDTTDYHIEPCTNEGSKQGGYYCFYCAFSFAADGKFVGVGVWE